MRQKIPLILVLLVFLVSRLYKITQIPPSVYWDEASIGYNAYAISTDLKDEWGSFLPLHFRAFGEFKLPVYIYSVAPFIKLLGLNAYAVRLPAVFYSLGSLILVYLLMFKITGKKLAGILAMFIFSLTPWFFIFSRTGYEATAGLFFFILGTYLFLLINKHMCNLFFGTLAFILSFYSYNSFRIIIPVWLIFLLVYVFRTFRKVNVPILILSLMAFLGSLIPVYRLYRYDAGGARYAQVKVSDIRDFVSNYFSHFSPGFLFFKGDANPRSQIPGRGQLYLLDLPFLILGFWTIYKSKKLLLYLPLVALILAPIPAALTRESPHALRALLAAPACAMITSLGMIYLSKKFRGHAGLFLAVTITVYLILFGVYFKAFLTRYSRETADAWQYQYEVIFAKQKSGVVTDQYAQPYIFALYYLKYPPEKFRETVKYNPVDNWGFSLVSSFDGFQFK